MVEIWKKILSVVKQTIYKCRFGKRIDLGAMKNIFGKNVSIRCDGSQCKISLNSVRLNNNVLISASNGGAIFLGNHVSCNVNTVIVAHKEIYVDDGCSIGPNVCIYDHDHYFDKNGFRKDDFRCSPVHIGSNTWIGAGCIILRGSTIGSNCIVGAGTIVKGNIPDNSIVKNNSSNVIEGLR